jgi:hypothetical protein
MKRKIGLAILLIGVLVVASIAITFFAEASVNYRLNPYVYQKVGDYWFTATNYYNISNPLINGTFTTIECQNTGLFDANFNIKVKINRFIKQQDFQLSQFVDSNTIVLTYNLHSGEKKSSNVNFSIDDGMIFTILIELQTNQLLIRNTCTNWGGQTVFNYGILGYYENHTLAPALIS